MLFHAKNVKSAGILPECRYTISQETTGAREKTDAPNPERDRRGDRLFDRHRVTRAERLAPNHARNARSVLACARRTGYRTACRRVALIVPGYQFDGYFGSVLRLLAAELGRLDYPVEVLSSTGLDVLEEHSFCGAISVMAQNGLERYWGDRHILPLVCINTRPRHLDGIYTVGSNDEQAVRSPSDILLERGHRPHRPLRRNLKLLRSVQLEQREP